MKQLMVNNFTKPENISWNEHFQNENLNVLILGMKKDLPRVVSMSQIDHFLNEMVPVPEEGIPLSDLKVQYFELSSVADTRRNLKLPLVFGLLMCEDFIIEEARNNQ